MRRRTCVWQYSRIDNGPGTSFLCIVFNCISVMLFIVQLFRVINWTLIKTWHLILFFSTSFCLFLSSSDLTYHATFNLTLHTPDTDAILICPVLPYPGLSCSTLPCPTLPHLTLSWLLNRVNRAVFSAWKGQCMFLEWNSNQLDFLTRYVTSSLSLHLNVCYRTATVLLIIFETTQLSSSWTLFFNGVHWLTVSPTHLLTLSLTHLLTHPLTHSLTNTLTHSLTHSLTHTLTHPHTHSPTHSLTHKHTHSPTHTINHSLTHSLNHSPTHSPTHSHTNTLTHSLTQSLQTP